jgi:hypothetical protein
LTAVAALCTPGSALAAGQKADAPAAAPATELAGPTADPAPVFAWLANWTW